jgi:hypothetical protein
MVSEKREWILQGRYEQRKQFEMIPRRRNDLWKQGCSEKPTLPNHIDIIALIQRLAGAYDERTERHACGSSCLNPTARKLINFIFESTYQL